MDQPRARLVTLDIGIEQPVDMFVRAAAALRGEARRLVQHKGGQRGADHHGFGEFTLLVAKRLAGAGCAFGGIAARRHAQHLARAQPVSHIGALAVHPDLSGARPAADRGKADLRQMALEPAVQPHPFIVRADVELANFAAHAATRAMASPANSATRPASTESSA